MGKLLVFELSNFLHYGKAKLFLLDEGDPATHLVQVCIQRV